MNSGSTPQHFSPQARAATAQAAARREQFAAAHPELIFSTRREGSGLVYEVSEPGQPAVAYDDPAAMLDDLEGRYA